MRVCYVLPKIIPAPNGAFVGGVTNCVVGLALAIHNSGIEIDLVTTIDEKEKLMLKTHPVSSILKGVSVRKGSMLIRGVYALSKLKQAIVERNKTNPYDIIHIHSGSFLYAHVAKTKALDNAQILHSIYCPIVTPEQPFFQKILIRHLVKRAVNCVDNLIGVSKNVYNTLKEAQIQKRIDFIPMCVDVNKYNDGVDTDINEKFFETTQNLRLLFVGNTSKDKGMNELIQSLSIIKKKGVGFRLIAAIENQSCRGELEKRRKTIEKEVQRMGLSDDIKILGVIPDIQYLMKEADIILFPFQNYTSVKGVSDYPMALLESLACGKCVVSTPFGGTNEVLIHRENGVVSSSFSPEAFAASIMEIIDSNELKKKLMKNARSSILAKFSTEKVAAQLMIHYSNNLNCMGD